MFWPAWSAAAHDLTLDEAFVLRLESDAAVIIIGNPAIADAAVENGRLLILTAKSPGQTNLIVLDKDGAEILSHSLFVAFNGARFVSVFQRSKRETLLCSPTCEHVVAPGDDAGAFKNAADAARQKIDLGDKAAHAKEPSRN
ncbi:MAG: pilus assembly protein N-terminal domain-containing protein [Chitinophagales bacterium]|nr:pilus assembly protein N-terminal domain-containing protein [Hyphomicrobiales bacterium]